VSPRAAGPFDVQLAPLPAYETDAEALLGRMSIDKQFRGDLEAASRGEMISATTAVRGSAAYSAIERVRGTLGGRRGAFVLQHTGVMDRGARSLRITVVPDSGTGELAGLAGTMDIQIDGGRHSYVFDYTLPDAGGGTADAAPAGAAPAGAPAGLPEGLAGVLDFLRAAEALKTAGAAAGRRPGSARAWPSTRGGCA
jgi:hypothetical protein